MLWDWFKNVIMFPVTWFWEQYQRCKEDKAIGKMILLFFFSITGLSVIGFALFLLLNFLIAFSAKHPEAILIVGGIIWIYLYGKSRMAKNEEQKELVRIQQEQNEAALNEKALQGYASIVNVMYQVLRGTALDIDCQPPSMIAEIEMPEGKYILRNNICFYQFMIQKKDIARIYSQEVLDEFKKTLQFTLHQKLHSGAFPSIQLEDYRDQHGNSYDGIVIDQMEDFGRYFQMSVIYISPDYAEYAHNRKMMLMQRSAVEGDLSVTWGNKL